MFVFQLKYTVAQPGQKLMLSIAKKVYFLFRKQQTTAYLSVCMHVVATLLDIK
jgi:nitrite reductase/ring-hydroxylating ferredoxin subunit